MLDQAAGGGVISAIGADGKSVNITHELETRLTSSQAFEGRVCL